MGNRLGDYIHWRYSGYKNNGIAFSNGQKPKPIGVLMDEWKDNIKKQIPSVPEGAIKEIEKKLNFYYSTDSSKTAEMVLTSEQKQLLEQLVRDKLKKEIGDRINNFTLDFDNLSAVSVTQASSSEMSKKFTKLQSDQYSYLSSIYNRILQIDQALAKLPPNSELKTSIQKFYEDFQDIVNKVRMQAAKSSKIQEKKFDYSRFSSESNWKNFREQLNYLVASCKFNIDRDISGRMAEYVAALMPHILEAKINKETGKLLSDLLEKHSHGTETSAKVVSNLLTYGARVEQRVAKNGNIVYTQKIGKYGISVDLTYTQNKVDATIATSFGSIPASVKNISGDSSSIHLLKGTSLLKYLQLYPEYANHYLNITANLGRSMSDKAPNSDVAIAHRGMLAAVGAHALAGGLLGSFKGEKGIYRLTDKALVLVINRRAGNTGKFEVYSINSLLNNIENHIYISGMNDTIEWRNSFNYDYSTSKGNYGRAYARCITILQQLHSQELKVSLKASALKKS